MATKQATTTEEAWNLQNTREGEPHCWIQWKGTNVCMDFYCECGEQSHVDADFTYHIKCPACSRVYFCNGHIELIALVQEPDTCVVTARE